MTPRQIKSLRLRLELTQAEFALRLGVARKTISLWESGRCQPHKIFVAAMREMK